MESILEKLLVADNNSIQEGTKELREAFKDPGVISSLCNVLVSSSNPQVRQYAAVLLRKRLSKSQHWTRLSAEAKAGIKEGLIQVYVKEQEKVVKNAIVQLIGTIMKLESGKLGWPEMMECLKMWVNSSVMEEKLLGLFALSILAEVVPDVFMEQYPVALYFSQMLVQTLRMPDISASPLAHLTLVCLAHFAPPVQHDQIAALYTESIPTMLALIGDLAKNRPGNSALEAMQVIDELLENNPAVLQPYLRLLVNFCLDIAVTRLPNITDEMRNKALNTLSEVVRVKKRVIVRDDLVSPILRVVFELIGKIPAGSVDGGEEEEQEEYFVDDEDDSTPTTCANQLLDTMALHLPPDKLLPLLMEYVEPSVTSADPCARKAAYLSMAMVSEGCADYVRTKHLEQFLRYVCQGITEQNTPVRNAALFALGQFSEHLQPEISVYSKELMPVLMEFLVELNKAGAVGDGGGEVARKAGVDRMFYALEMFCENLDEALLPYLQPLMEHLLPLVVPPHATHVRELAISAIGATANAAKTNMLPYFETVMKHLQHYLTEEQTEETLCLQIQAVDTVGVFARTVGADNFMPMAVESIELGLKLLSKVDDPDLRKAVYGLFASVSSVLKLNMASYLPAILEPIMNSVKSEDGIVAHYDDETSVFPDPDELSGEEGDEEDIDKDSDISSDDVTAYTVVNAYVEEKEEACLALKEVAANTCHAFLPFLHACFEETIKLLRFPHDYVKKAALEAVTQFVINFFDPVSQQSQEVKREALSLLIPKLSEMVRTEEEIEVVMVALNSFTELLKELGSDAVQGEGHSEAVLECIKDVLTHKTECQNDMDEDEEAMDEEAEQDELLVESAGEIVPHLGKALGPEAFSYHYSHLLPLFQALTKKKCSPAQRSFGVGVIAECMSALGERTVVFKDTLLPLLIGLSSDRDADVRNNAIFALGELALHAKAGLFAEYAQVLHALSTAVATETHAATLDNIVAALARLIVTNVDAIPLDQVLPVYVQYLPLREDYEENKWIFKSFEILYQKGSDSLRNLLVPVIKISTSVIHKEQIEPENKDLVINLLRQCHLDFPNDCVTAASQMTPEEAEILRSICTAS